jgi:hypothetical protein
VDSCWVLGGIHAGDFPDDAAAERHAGSAGMVPEMAMQYFSW